MNKSIGLEHLRSSRSQVGKINLVTIIILLLIASGAYLAYKFVPPYSTDYEFTRFLEIQYRNAYDWSEETIRSHIKEFAIVNNFTIKEENLGVSKYNKEIYITVDYYIRVEIPFNMDRVLHFSHQIKEEVKPKKEM